MSITVYADGTQRSRIVGSAFACGAGGDLAIAPKSLVSGVCAFYGVAPGTLHLFTQAVAENREFYYIDNGYFSAAPTRHIEDGFFRVTRNAEQCEPWDGPFESHRFDALNLAIHPARMDGNNILIVLQTDFWFERHGLSRDQWVESVRDQVTTGNRPIKVRQKRRQSGRVPIEQDLARAWCVIVHTSMVGAEATLFGKPVFATARSALSGIASNNLSLIENPPRPSVETRYQWACGLANNQWTLEEMRSGRCTAFARGCGGMVVGAPRRLRNGLAVFYGVSPETKHLYGQAIADRRPFYYIDNGYFGAIHTSEWRRGYFRVTKNAAQCDAWKGPFDPLRWDCLGLRFSSWRDGGAYILIALQDASMYQRHGTTLDAWLTYVRQRLPVGAPIRVRAAPQQTEGVPPLAIDLEGARSIVVHSSMAAAEAVLAGVPAFATHHCALSGVASDDLSMVFRPPLQTRYRWACGLANNQWTINEMESGQCWSDLMSRAGDG
jgi:hypothetical protein